MHISSRRLPTHVAARSAGLLIAAVLAIACLSLAPSPAHAAAEKTFFPQGFASTHSYKPHRLLLSGDGTLFVRHAHWRVWNHRRAVGTGVAFVDDCVPNCAAGTLHRHHVTIRLTRPRHLCGARFFTRFRLSGQFSFHTTAKGILCV